MHRIPRWSVRSGTSIIFVAMLALLPVLTPAQSRNVLVIVADDLGVDMLPFTCPIPQCASMSFPPTPNLEALRQSGVLFTHAYANTLCSPTRATLLTGRYGFRTGVGYVTPEGSSTANTLPLSESILPEVLDAAGLGHGHAALGKWHLTNESVTSAPNDVALGPNLSGFDHYAGSLFNLSGKMLSDPNDAPTNAGYFIWEKTTNGSQEIRHAYATTDNVEDAKDWIALQSGPWLLWLAFNAAHTPYHVPPDGMHTYMNLAPSPGDFSRACPPGQNRQCYEAMIQAMDNRIGHLLGSLTAEQRAATTIIFVGDNGTPNLSLPPFNPNRSKDTVYEGGIHVPLIIGGAGVVNPGRTSAALVNTTDLFATVIELATGQSAASLLAPGTVLDAHSLVPILEDVCQTGAREWVFSEEIHGTSSERALRNGEYKLIRFVQPPTPTREEFYDLQDDPLELTNLLLQGQLTDEQHANLTRLRNQLTILVRPGTRCGPCVVSYCDGEGRRCTFDNTCGVSRCCNYTCVEDENCSEPTALPPNACTGCSF